MYIICTIRFELTYNRFTAPASIPSSCTVDPLDIILSVLHAPDRKLNLSKVPKYSSIRYFQLIFSFCSVRVSYLDSRLHRFHCCSWSVFLYNQSISSRQVGIHLVFSGMILMVCDADCHPVCPVCLSLCFIPVYIL